jgi:hypothetical protein
MSDRGKALGGADRVWEAVKGKKRKAIEEII